MLAAFFSILVIMMRLKQYQTQLLFVLMGTFTEGLCLNVGTI